MYKCRLCGDWASAPLCPRCLLIVILFGKNTGDFDRFRRRVTLETIDAERRMK
jgi:hypothetical protein